MALISRPSLTIQELYSIIHPYTIFKYYCINWATVGYTLNKNFKADSDLRPGDTNPSARITVSNNQELYYIDYADNTPYRAVNYVASKFNITIQEAVEKIYTEVKQQEHDISIENTQKILSQVKKHKHNSKILKIKSRSFTQKDLDYWEQYGWNIDMLKKARIKPITQFWINGKRYSAYGLAYSFEYYFHNDIFRRKIYFPLKETNRFVSNIDNTVVQGWHMLPKKGGDVLIITKAYKDIGTFMNIGIHACATNNETSFFPEKVVEKIKSRWNTVLLWWDNDTEGINSGEKYSKRYNIPLIYNPVNSPKDPSDYFKELGRSEFKQLVNKKLKKYEI